MRVDDRMLPGALIALLIAFLLVLSALANTARAEIGEDIHIQQTGEVRIEVDRQVFEEFARLFGLGYPPATVMMHAISTGMSINDVLYIAIKSHPNRAQEFYDTAASLLPALPGWVSQAEVDPDRYTREVAAEELGDDPSVREVAALFFESRRRVVPFPDWSQGQVHMQASVSELVDLVTDKQWYVAGRNDGSPRTIPNRPVFISLYRHNKQIVVDSGIQRIRQAQEQGVERLPVVLVYNNRLQRPISDFEKDVTLDRLAEVFYEDAIELTAVPEWQVGDHHKSATVDELREVVDIPDRDDIDPERWETLAQQLRESNMELSKPLLMTLVRSGQGRAWIDDPARVAVAEELGMDSLPVVLFYHRIDRTPCGQPSSGEDLLCEAASAAGASLEECEGVGQEAATQPGRSNDSVEMKDVAQAASLDIDDALYNGLSYTQDQCAS